MVKYDFGVKLWEADKMASGHGGCALIRDC